MDAIRQTLKIFDVNLIFTRKHPAYSFPVVGCYSSKNPSLVLMPNAAFCGLSAECCSIRKGPCLRNLEDLPTRLALSADLRQLVIENGAPLYCPEEVGCNMVVCDADGLRDIVVERVAQVQNWMNRELVFPWLQHPTFERYLGITQIYYQHGTRVQMRMPGGGRPRRNFINTIVLHPYHNAYRFHHFTFDHRPPTEVLEAILVRIMDEAANLCTTSALAQMGYHCRCRDTRAIPLAVRPEYFSAEEREFLQTNDALQNIVFTVPPQVPRRSHHKIKKSAASTSTSVGCQTDLRMADIFTAQDETVVFNISLSPSPPALSPVLPAPVKSPKLPHIATPPAISPVLPALPKLPQIARPPGRSSICHSIHRSNGGLRAVKDSSWPALPPPNPGSPVAGPSWVPDFDDELPTISQIKRRLPSSGSSSDAKPQKPIPKPRTVKRNKLSLRLPKHKTTVPAPLVLHPRLTPMPDEIVVISSGDQEDSVAGAEDAADTPSWAISSTYEKELVRLCDEASTSSDYSSLLPLPPYNQSWDLSSSYEEELVRLCDEASTSSDHSHYVKNTPDSNSHNNSNSAKSSSSDCVPPTPPGETKQSSTDSSSIPLGQVPRPTPSPVESEHGLFDSD